MNLIAKRPARSATVCVAAAFAALLGMDATRGGIQGSVHDFSGRIWSGGKICIVCHTPHHADPTVDPLWNHTLSTAAYTLYSSPTLNSIPGQPGVQSRLCLSCHDGTVAIDSFGGMTGGEYVSGDRLIGTDLADDHPIGMTFYHDGPLNCQNCHQMHPWGFASVLPFFDGKVECATCHEPHNNGVPGTKLLRKTVSQSALCLHCHAK